MAAESILRTKCEDFALRIINCYKFLCQEKNEFVLSKQLLRSGTSIGANVTEGIYAQSRNDFISKLCISLKEAQETSYWLRLLFKSEYISKNEFSSIHNDNEEIIKLLTASIKSTKGSE